MVPQISERPAECPQKRRPALPPVKQTRPHRSVHRLRKALPKASASALRAAQRLSTARQSRPPRAWACRWGVKLGHSPPLSPEPDENALIPGASHQLRGEELRPGQQEKEPGAEGDFDRQQVGDSDQERQDGEFEPRGEGCEGRPRFFCQHFLEIEGKGNLRRKYMVVVESVNAVDQDGNRGACCEDPAAEQRSQPLRARVRGSSVSGTRSRSSSSQRLRSSVMHPHMAEQKAMASPRPCHQRQHPGSPGKRRFGLERTRLRPGCLPGQAPSSRGSV